MSAVCESVTHLEHQFMHRMLARKFDEWYRYLNRVRQLDCVDKYVRLWNERCIELGSKRNLTKSDLDKISSIVYQVWLKDIEKWRQTNE